MNKEELAWKQVRESWLPKGYIRGFFGCSECGSFPPNCRRREIFSDYRRAFGCYFLGSFKRNISCHLKVEAPPRLWVVCDFTIFGYSVIAAAEGSPRPMRVQEDDMAWTRNDGRKELCTRKSCFKHSHWFSSLHCKFYFVSKHMLCQLKLKPFEELFPWLVSYHTSILTLWAIVVHFNVK